MFNLSDYYIMKLRTTFGLPVTQDTELETYLKSKYSLMDNIAYTQKRKITDLAGDIDYYPIFLNELITPDSFMVKQLLRGTVLSDVRLPRVRSVGNLVARAVVWTPDNNLDTSGDYYLYPNETLALGKGDCEDHAYVMMSALPEDCGGAWGTLRGEGHCFNITLLNGELWVVDTVGNQVNTVAYDSQSDYKINYIITKKYTFVVDGSVAFGTVAGWKA